MTYKQALEAIKARINGEYDNPSLVAFGPLSLSASLDCIDIAQAALNTPQDTEKRGRLTPDLQCPSCGRDYKPDADDGDIFPGALCPVDDCPGVGE